MMFDFICPWCDYLTPFTDPFNLHCQHCGRQLTDEESRALPGPHGSKVDREGE